MNIYIVMTLLNNGQALTMGELVSLPGEVVLNRHLYITVNTVVVDVTDEDKPKTTHSRQFISAVVRADECSVSFLGLNRHGHSNTFHQLHWLLVDCCTETGNLIASIVITLPTLTDCHLKNLKCLPLDSHVSPLIVWHFTTGKNTWTCLSSLLAESSASAFSQWVVPL